MDVIEKYKKYFVFDGKASRSEYWGISIICYVLVLPALFFAGILGGLIIIWTLLSTTARRCRDAGINPWFSATILIPWIAVIAVIVFGCLKTEKSDEHYNRMD
jgi:uncharacterized membrane protein YhaH (DUF805 family)